MTRHHVPNRPLRTPRTGTCAALLCFCMLSLPAMAEPVRTLVWEEMPERPKLGKYVGEVGIDPALFTESFLSAHPDLRWRREALHAFSNKQYELAMKQFRRAARHADKPSQAMIAEMYWEGLGVAQDRPLAYAWMDIAAERMYPNFLILRESYWHALDENQREDAIRRGQTILAEFGDDVAKPRMARVLSKHRRQITGSRTGFVGPGLTVVDLRGPASTGVDLSELKSPFGARVGGVSSGHLSYDEKYWVPEQYWASQDEVWRALPAQTGSVHVGDLKQADDEDTR